MENNSNVEDKENNYLFDSLMMEIQGKKNKKEYEEALNLIENKIGEIEKNYTKESDEYFNISKEFCDICNIISEIYSEIGKFNEGTKKLEKPIKLFENYMPILHIIYNNLGIFYRKIGEFAKAFEYFTKSLQNGINLKSKRIAGEGYIHCSIILLLIGKYDYSIELSLSGIILLQEFMLNNKELISEIEIILKNGYINIAVCYYKKNNFLESLLYYDIAEKINEKSENTYPNQNIIIDDEKKYKMLKNILNNLELEKNISDKKEKMANNYMKEKLKKLIKNIEEKHSCDLQSILPK